MNRQEWLEQRRLGIGSSDIPVIMGYQKYKSRLELWAEKTGKIEEAQAGLSAWYGKRIEHALAELYEKKTNIELTRDQEIYEHDEYPWQFATPDYFYTKNDLKITVELKHTAVFDGWAPTEVPLHVGMQIHWQMHVQNQTFCEVFALICGRVESAKPITVYKEQEFLDVILEEAHKFYELIQKDTPPEAGPGDLAVIERLVKERKGAMEANANQLHLLPRYADSIESYKRAKRIAEEKKATKDSIQNNIILQMGDAISLLSDGLPILKITRTKNGQTRVYPKDKNIYLLTHHDRED